MDIRKLQRAIVDGLEDVKAQHIVVFNTEHLSSMFERVIIASGSSNRQTKALASSVRESVKSRGMQVMATEGEDNGEWIIVDCGAAVAHIMQPSIREYYHLEEIWGGKAVKLKLGEAKTGLVKASEPEPAAKPAHQRAGTAVASRQAATKTTTRPTGLGTTKPAGKASAKTAAKAPTKTPTKAPARAPANTSAKAPAASATRAPAKPAPKVKTLVIAPSKPARKAPAKKAAAKRAPAKKAPGRSR